MGPWLKAYQSPVIATASSGSCPSASSWARGLHAIASTSARIRRKLNVE